MVIVCYEIAANYVTDHTFPVFLINSMLLAHYMYYSLQPITFSIFDHEQCQEVLKVTMLLRGGGWWIHQSTIFFSIFWYIVVYFNRL